MARCTAVTSGGRSVGAPCRAFSLSVPGEVGARLCAGPWGPGVSFSRSFCICGLLCDPLGCVGSVWFPHVPFPLPVQSHSLRCADGQGLQGPQVGVLTPACGPGMWTHSPERHRPFTSGWCSGQARSATPPPERSLRSLLTDEVLIIPLRTVCNDRAVSTLAASREGRGLPAPTKIPQQD